MKALLKLFVFGVALLFAMPADVRAQDDMKMVKVAFPAGSTGTTMSDSITSYGSVAYQLGAEAGQVMTVSLSPSSGAVYFNIYPPGKGPGDEALANSELTPVINQFEGVLPTSGTYTVTVYQVRAAARRNESPSFTIDFSIKGAMAKTVPNDFADGMAGGPDFFEVRTTGNGSLNVRSSPSASAGVVIQLSRGAVVRNLGCRAAEGRTWCNIASARDDVDFEGWAAADFLGEASAPGGAMPADTDAMVAGTDFNATGSIACVRDRDAADAQCEFGVTREGNGNGMLTIFWPDGGARVIFFEDGTPVYFDQSQADEGKELTVTREGDNSIVFVGEERFVIPDAVIFGG